MAWTPTGGGDHSGADWTISSPLTIGGAHTNIGTFTLDTGITATLVANTELEIHSSITNCLGTVQGDSKGHLSASGTGAGSSTGNSNNGGGGGGYGGSGAPGDGGVAGGIAYDTQSDYVASMGSGGGNGVGYSGGLGGGSVQIISDILTIGAASVITCDGGSGSVKGGGGAGGSIFLSAYTLSNAGALTAEGGDSSASGGSGGGGRIKQFYGNTIVDTSSKSVVAGFGYAAVRNHGTVYTAFLPASGGSQVIMF